MKKADIIAAVVSLTLFSIVILIKTHDHVFDWKFHIGWLGFITTLFLMFFYKNKSKDKIEILNDYIIIEPIEVNQPTGLHRTVQDQSKLVYRDALVKFTPKNSIVKPGDTVIFNKSMAYPYILDGKQHLIITEEYIVCIK